MGVLRDPFFLYPQLLAWPDQLDLNQFLSSTELPSDQRAAGLFRLGEVGRAQSLLVAHLADLHQSQQASPLALLAWMRLEDRDLSGFHYVFRELKHVITVFLLYR